MMRDLAVRLATGLSWVKSAVNLVDDNRPEFTVEWAEEGRDTDGKTFSMSFTDFSRRRIAVNPTPYTEGRVSDDLARRVCIGFGLHEASHALHSRDRWKLLLNKDEKGRERPVMRPMRVAAYLFNLVEDVRIEALTVRAWPGFGPGEHDYFGTVLDYLWSGKAPERYGPDLQAKMQTMFLACRYPDRCRTVLTDPSFAAEIPWWQAWQDDYLSDRVDPVETMRRGLEHLGVDPETRRELDKMAAEEQKAEEAGERIRDQLRRLMKEGMEGVEGFCINRDGEVIPLDRETAEKVRQMAREGLIEVRTPHPAPGAANPPIYVRRPEETTQSRGAYIGQPSPTVQALRAALVFRSAAPQHDEKLLPSGELDESELWRFGYGETRLFSRREIEGKPDVLMALLVDLSGSMAWGHKLQTAQELAQLFVYALHDQEGVTTKVWGHTGDVDATGAHVYRLYEPGDSMMRLGLISTLPHSSNYDGHALGYVVEQIRNEPQPQKVVIVLSDGVPAGSGYGDIPAQQHVRQIVRYAEKAGVEVWQIAIEGGDLRPDQQTRMYGDKWLPFTSTSALPRQLAKLMGRFA